MNNGNADKNIRNAVDGVFRQNTLPTPTKIIQDVLSSSEESGNDTVNTTAEEETTAEVAATKPSMLTRPEMSLPPPDVAPIATDAVQSAPSSSSSSFWVVFFVIAMLISVALLLYYNVDAVRNWFDSNVQYEKTTAQVTPALIKMMKAATMEQTAPEKPITLTTAKPIFTSQAALQTMTGIEATKTTEIGAAKAPTAQTAVEQPKKTVRIDESRNTIQIIDTTEPPHPASATTTAEIASAVNATHAVVLPPIVISNNSTNTDEMIRKLEQSLDNLAQTSMDMQAQRDAAIAATDQKKQAALLRLDERDQFSRDEQIATVEIDNVATNAKNIYNKNGGNNVVGNRLQAPFVTFAPGEEPFEGMIPDYEEPAQNAPPPLRSGQPHSMFELINDHCIRTGKPLPKAADQSTLDVMSKRDTATLAPMRAADCDGHYLDSQKKQFELQRLNQTAIKKIYSAKHASATGQILDRGQTTLSSFAAARDDDAVQYLNVNSL